MTGITKIYVVGEFKKEHLAKLLKEMWKIQKEVNPEKKKEKYFLILISNDTYSDKEVRDLIRENFKDCKVIDLVEAFGDKIEDGLSKQVAG